MGRSAKLGSYLEAAWRRGVLSRPRLSDLRARAKGLPDDSPWRGAFDRLIDSLSDEANLNPVGLTFAYVQIAALLGQRERAERLWRLHPQILAIPLQRPVIVLGQMRSGTTRLHRLLGCDERFNHTRFFEVMSPLPPRPDTRIPASWLQLKLLEALNPHAGTIHPTTARAVEEVFGLLSFSFYGAQLEAQWRVPAFARYWQDRDRGWVYREFRQLLQTLAWQRGSSRAPWVLKAPQFMEDLEPLLQVMPDARLICLDRDLTQVVASSASLVANQMAVQSNTVDRDWIGEEWLGKTVRRQQACAAVLDARPDVPRIAVDFEAMNRDWLVEVRRIYAFLGLELEPRVVDRMRAYLRKAERTGFRRHSYRLEDYGLSEQRVRSALGAGARGLAG